jgi:V8-like Glu-specific endopeptidase
MKSGSYCCAVVLIVNHSYSFATYMATAKKKKKNAESVRLILQILKVSENYAYFSK